MGCCWLTCKLSSVVPHRRHCLPVLVTAALKEEEYTCYHTLGLSLTSIFFRFDH